MTVSLTAQDGTLPLAFEQYEHLSRNDKPAYLDASGRPLQGARLNAALHAEGVGLKRVRLGVLYSDVGSGDTIPTTLDTEVIGTLDADGLARIIHAQARQFTGRRDPGNSPALLFVQSITVGDVVPEVRKLKKGEPRTRKPRVVRQFVKVRSVKTGKVQSRAVYRDKRTGRFASRAQWKDR